MLSMLFASVGSVGAEPSIMSSQPLAMAMVAEADMAGEPGHAHDGHHAPAKAHDHKAAGASDCATHCLTAVPVSRNLSYPILTTDLTGQSGPTTERPPRI